MTYLRNTNKWLQKNLFLNANPHIAWKITRFIIHWLTLPVKLLVIGALGLFQIARYSLKSKRQPLTELFGKVAPDIIEKMLPVMRHEDYDLYLPRQPYDAPVNGRHHNPDHQTSRHGTYTFLITKAGLDNRKAVSGLYRLMLKDFLCRGYTIDEHGLIEYNLSSVSGDMLCGLALAVNEIDAATLFEIRYEQLIASIIQSDYSLREYDGPMEDDAGILPEIYQERLAEAKHDMFNVNMKSNRASWSPGIETVGAQALTVLAALRVSDAKFGDPLARKHYKRLLWLHGYGLLSLFPTAYIDSRRGYFNEHNCIMALYVLAKNAEHKWFWFLPMLYTWALSKHWHNMYFDGLFIDAYPFMGKFLKNHVDLSRKYLEEVDITKVTKRPDDVKEVPAEESPVNLNEIYDDEFYPDVRRDVKTIPLGTGGHHAAGLGFLADTVMSKYLSDKLGL